MAQYELGPMTTFKGEVRFGGVPYESFDRTGHWSIWGIAKMFEASRLLGLHQGMFDFKLVDNKEKGFVVVTQRMKLSTKLHTDYSVFTTLPQQHTLEIENVGKTSFSFITRLYHAKTKEKLGTIILKYVLIDRTTRRPTPLPESFVEKYKALYKINGGVKQISWELAHFPEVTSERRTYQIRLFPLYSDTDRNNHVNQSVYLRYCSDCATAATINGAYRHFTSDICWYPVQEVNIHHVNESLVNEELIVSTWQDDDDYRILHFLIHHRKSSRLLLKTSFLMCPEKTIVRPSSRI